MDAVHVVKDNMFPIPPLFRYVHACSGTDWKEMYKVFNMGHRLEVYLPAEHADEVIAVSKSFGIEAQVIGRVEAAPKGTAKVTVKSSEGTFVYDQA